MLLRLECTKCAANLPFETTRVRCPNCGEPLEYRGYDAVPQFEQRSHQQSLLERYAPLLPSGGRVASVSMGEGFTPLTSMPRLAETLGIGRLAVKNESLNPTWSFKDRGTAVAVADAIERDFRALGVVSTGNMAASVSAYGARVALPVIVLVSTAIPDAKIGPIAAYGSFVVKVSGDYSDLYHRSIALQKLGVRFLNSDAPARVEGSKTIAFELWEQCRGELPDWVVVPTSSGGNIRGIMKGFAELRQLGIVSSLPRFVCAQASSCAPICTAYDEGASEVRRSSWSGTIAHAIENPLPPSGNEVLRRLRAGAGLCVSVSDDDIRDAQNALANEGLFVQPAAAVPVAATKKLVSDELANRESYVVCVATGSGLKYPESLDGVTRGTAECFIEDVGEVVARWLQTESKGERL